jgi:hypothetical protein
MRPLARCGDTSNAALGAHCHPDDDQQDDIHADIGQDRNLLACCADEDHRRGEQRESDDRWSDDCGLRDCFHG